MSAFLTVERGEHEFEVSRSRFIAFAVRVRSDDEANRFLSEIRRKYRDCTHVCHAYITADSSRSSDDGEPSGTAGMPIAECIRSAGLCETLVAVVRYFGGIKLGTGGLLRAYTQAAAGAIERAGRVEVADCDIIKVSYDYAVWKKIEKRPLQSLYKSVGLEYNRTVDVVYAVTDRVAAEEEINTLTLGKCELTYLGREKVERKRV